MLKIESLLTNSILYAPLKFLRSAKFYMSIQESLQSCPEYQHITFFLDGFKQIDPRLPKVDMFSIECIEDKLSFECDKDNNTVILGRALNAHYLRHMDHVWMIKTIMFHPKLNMLYVYFNIHNTVTGTSGFAEAHWELSKTLIPKMVQWYNPREESLNFIRQFGITERTAYRYFDGMRCLANAISIKNIRNMDSEQNKLIINARKKINEPWNSSKKIKDTFILPEELQSLYIVEPRSSGKDITAGDLIIILEYKPYANKYALVRSKKGYDLFIKGELSSNINIKSQPNDTQKTSNNSKEQYQQKEKLLKLCAIHNKMQINMKLTADEIANELVKSNIIFDPLDFIEFSEIERLRSIWPIDDCGKECPICNPTKTSKNEEGVESNEKTNVTEKNKKDHVDKIRNLLKLYRNVKLPLFKYLRW